jgi:hypothetical protein
VALVAAVDVACVGCAAEAVGFDAGAAADEAPAAVCCTGAVAAFTGAGVLLVTGAVTASAAFVTGVVAAVAAAVAGAGAVGVEDGAGCVGAGVLCVTGAVTCLTAVVTVLTGAGCAAEVSDVGRSATAVDVVRADVRARVATAMREVVRRTRRGAVGPVCWSCCETRSWTPRLNNGFPLESGDSNDSGLHTRARAETRHVRHRTCR